jgi:hypothetical protein
MCLSGKRKAKEDYEQRFYILMAKKQLNIQRLIFESGSAG